MDKFIITYDLNCPGKNYASLIAKIKTFTNAKISESAWIIRSNANYIEVRDSLSKEMDENDNLFVGKLTGAAAWKIALAQLTK